MKYIVGLLLIVCLIGVTCALCRCVADKQRLIESFSRGNVIVYGSKGKGKDLLFQGIIKARKKPYYANISYGGKFKPFKNIMLELGENNYSHLVDGTIKTLDKANYPFEDQDIYISDGGIILPSQMDSNLHKKYPTFPIAYALSRHLWNNNIHINSQALNRVWKALREQADTYIRCLHVIHLPFFLVVECISYDKYESACNNVLPMKKAWLNGTNKALLNQFIASNGHIEKRYLLISKKSIQYDTRAYHQIIFGTKAPKNHLKTKKPTNKNN